MPAYKAPLRDTRFLLNEVLDYPAHYGALAAGAEATPDVVEAILGECARLCEDVIAPLYHSGDEEGCHWENGEVRTPQGFKEAYQPLWKAAGRACRTRSSTVARACR